MALQGFNKSYYLNAKLEQLQNDPDTAGAWAGKSVDFLESKLQNGYGLTAEEHYQQYGYQEGLAPNDFFDPQQYIQAKAVAMFNDPETSYLSVDAAAEAFVDLWGGNVYQHYLQYGASEGINPSNAFDASAYLEEKLAALQAAGETQYQNVEDVREAFADAGLTPLGHFLAYGQEEGLTAPAVPADEQVDVDTSTPGQVFSLTTGVDDVQGTADNDTFKGVLDAADSTLTALDTIDGGAGTDTLSVLAAGTGTVPASLVLNSVETVSARSAGGITLDTSATGFSSVNDVNVTQALGATGVTASSSQDVSVSGVSTATGTIDVDGGKDVTVTDATADNAITVGANTAAAGTIDVTDTKQGSGAIAVDGGTDVTVAATSEDTGSITVGDQAADGVAADGSDVASGAINITQNLENDATAPLTGGAIAVEGGSTVDVTVNANSVAASSADDADITVGGISVTGYDNTTTVNVTQNDNVTQSTSAAVGGTTETASVKFGALKSGDSLEIAGLTFTASKDLTAAQVAAAFSDLTATDRQDDGGSTANGTYTGQVDGSVISGAASGDTVVFTSTTENSNETDLNPTLTNTSGNSVDPVTTVTDGAAVTAAADASQNDVVFGDVTIADGGDDSITDVTVDGYGNSTVNANALANLSLANGVGTMGVTSTATALDLTVNNVDGEVTLDAALTSLNLTSETEESSFVLGASGVESLTVNAAADLDLAGSTMSTNLETVSISGAGEVNLTSIAGATGLNSFDASANTGGVEAIVNANAANVGTITEYVFSAGGDDVTLSDTTVDVAVSLGAGDDTVTLASGTTSLGAVVNAGAGTDTLVMDAADAVTASSTTTFETKIDGFEKLSLNAASAAGTVDLAKMDDINYVVSKNSSAVAAVAEVFTATFADNADTDTSSITFDGVTVSMAGTEATDAEVAAKFVTDYNAAGAATWTAVDNGDGTVTFTAKTAGTRTDVTAADFVVANATTSEAAAVDVTAVTVDTQGAATGGADLTLDNMANDGTVELTEGGAGVVVDMLDATGSADSLNVKVSNEDTIAAGTVTAADVETINVESNDIFTDTDNNGEDDNVAAHTLTVGGNDASTVMVTGNGNITLTAGSDALTTVDASAMTGNLSYTADGATAGTTVTGGMGDDVLEASGSNDVLNGGAGNDTLTGDNLSQLTGGEGDDTFAINAPSSVNAYSTITDLAAGDTIELANTTVFSSAQVELADTAVFQDYANDAMNSLGTGEATWFQFGGDTFVVADSGVESTSFVNGQDSIIQIAGEVDLSMASYNQTAGTLEIA